MDLPSIHFGRRSRRRLAALAGGGAVLLIAAVAIGRLTATPLAAPAPERSPADALCDPASTPEVRSQAARDAAKQGVLRLALERSVCVPAGRTAGLSMLAFVYDKVCSSDACLEALLHSPRDTEAMSIAKAHKDQVTKALAAQPCELSGPASEALVRVLLGPAGAVITGTARGLLPESAAPGIQRLLETREPAAVLLLHALFSTPFCGDDRVAVRQALAGILLAALGIEEQDPVDLPAALSGVTCGPLLLLSPRLRLEQLPRLAEAAPSLVACGQASRMLRTRALGYAGSRPSPLATEAAPSPTVPELRARVEAIDRRERRRLVLPAEASSPAVALLSRGTLRAVAYTTGLAARVCGLPALAAYDDQGRRRLELDPAGVRFLDGRGVVRVRLEAQTITFHDGQGQETLRVPAGEAHGVRLIDAAGRLRARGQWNPDSVQLRLSDGETVLAQLITDRRGAQLQVGAWALDALPEGAPCRPPLAHGGERARFALLAPSGPFPLDTAPALLPPLDLDDHTMAAALEESWDGPGLRLSGLGAARAPAPR